MVIRRKRFSFRHHGRCLTWSSLQSHPIDIPNDRESIPSTGINACADLFIPPRDSAGKFRGEPRQTSSQFCPYFQCRYIISNTWYSSIFIYIFHIPSTRTESNGIWPFLWRINVISSIFPTLFGHVLMETPVNWMEFGVAVDCVDQRQIIWIVCYPDILLLFAYLDWKYGQIPIKSLLWFWTLQK